MRIVANRTGFYKVSMSAENIIHVHYIIWSKDTSVALLQHYLVFASSPWPDKSCSFDLPRVPFVNCCQFMYLVVSLLVLRAGYGIWLYQFLIIAYPFTLQRNRVKFCKLLNCNRPYIGFYIFSFPFLFFFYHIYFSNKIETPLNNTVP